MDVKRFRTVEKHMKIKGLVVQFDQTPAAQVRLDAVLVLKARSGRGLDR